jgi:hypothetical protein
VAVGEYVIEGVYMFDSAVVQVGLFLSAFFVAIKIAIRLVAFLTGMPWPIPPFGLR